METDRRRLGRAKNPKTIPVPYHHSIRYVWCTKNQSSTTRYIHSDSKLKRYEDIFSLQGSKRPMTCLAVATLVTLLRGSLLVCETTGFCFLSVDARNANDMKCPPSLPLILFRPLSSLSFLRIFDRKRGCSHSHQKALTTFFDPPMARSMENAFLPHANGIQTVAHLVDLWKTPCPQASPSRILYTIKP